MLVWPWLFPRGNPIVYVSMSWNDRHKILNGCNRAKEFAWHMSLGLRDSPQRTAERSVPPLNEAKNKIYSYPFCHPRKIQQKNLKVRLAFCFTLKHTRQFPANGCYQADTLDRETQNHGKWNNPFLFWTFVEKFPQTQMSTCSNLA